MKYIYTTLLLILPLLVNSQVGSISGYITVEDGTPLLGANIYTEDIMYGVSSDVEGYYELSDLPYGDYKLIISFVGYIKQVKNVTISATPFNLDIQLLPDPSLLDGVTIEDLRAQQPGLARLRAVEDVAIYASKKNDIINIDQLTVNKASNLSRQIYAKVAGLNIWESDGAGVQLGIGGRGLSPNRNSNFNTRQNGYDISADALGYPESYYTPPVEAIERIEVVRGAASLQYGTQFGGMLNFRFKHAQQVQPMSVHTRQSYGSFGFFNSYNSLSGNIGKLDYFTFYQYKRSDGWRPNAGLNQHNGYASVGYHFTDKFLLRGEYTHSQYVAQQPGGLTDTQFDMDPRQSNRERNWFRVNWNLMALIADYQFPNQVKINTKFFGLIAGRDAVGNLSNINLIDFGQDRDLLVDKFRNWGNETRLLYQYNTYGQPSTLLVGGRYYQGRTLRMQGNGDDGRGPSFDYLTPENLEGSDFTLPSKNISFFAENVFSISPKWSITPGVRFESISTKADGYYREINRDLAGNILQDNRIQEYRENDRSFLFAGVGASYRPSDQSEIYINISQNYRAINFNDIRVNVGNLVVDENLTDERGYTADLGWRGTLQSNLSYDINAYHISYSDRIGTILKKEPNPVFNGLVDRVIRFRSNIGDANIYGAEVLLQYNLLPLFQGKTSISQGNRNDHLSLFSNLAWTTASYQSIDPAIDGNDVELVPDWIYKAGLQGNIGRCSGSLQYSYTASQYSDASNAIITPTAVEGLIPSYDIWDISLSYQLSKLITIEANVNNLLDNHYFTRRASGYPGPGIIPSDGRSIGITVDIKL